MSPVAGKITALMTAAAYLENNNNSGTISVKADIFAAGGRGDGGGKEGRVKAHPTIPNLRPNRWRDWHRFPVARSLTANEGLGRRKST